ncbi:MULTISPECIES: hypothetical protein [unclassified Pseudoalteromonas]|jgi:hypothetical protein|uniref:hypothetical protein n=1 Tax=unclassified Pseudoalteromonas TaxID=194690 RepID=UPI00040EC560|nr:MULTISPECIES: hypothetical protein [unclassified Pseudoalteromonas]
MADNNVLLFIPRHELEFETNVDDFIRLVEAAPNPNDKIDYNSYYWPKIGNFTRMGVNSRVKDKETWLDDSIIKFAKAYIKYQAIKSGTSMYAHFYALRAIEAVFQKRGEKVDIARLLPRDFDYAAQEAKRNMAEGAAYQAGMKLNALRAFLIEHQMMKPFEWKNPFNKPKGKKDQTGEVGQAYRESKMPDENSIMAMATIFAKKETDLSARDIFTTSTFSLMMSAPERGSEPLYLKADCLDIRQIKKSSNDYKVNPEAIIEQDDATELLFDEDDVSTEDSQLNKEQIGIRWFSGKGYGHENKWIPDVMNPVVKTAIKRLQKQSEKARAFAKMLEESDEFPRHPLCPKVDEDKPLTKNQAVAALGLDTSKFTDKQTATSGNQILRRKGIERVDFAVTLRDLNKIVRQNLPDEWPYVPFKKGKGKVRLKWSEALYAGFSNQFDKRRSTIFTELWMPDITTLNEDLKPTLKKNRSTGEIAVGNLSIFGRHGLKNLELRSHQPRHLLDTMASVNGMSDTLRSKWAGRADPKHNRYYDHTDEQEYNRDWLEEEIAGNLAAIDDVKNLFKVQIAKGNSRSLQEHNTLTSLAIHITEFGECKQSYIDQPCMKHRDCVNCNEQICVKGNKENLTRLEDKYKKEKLLLKGDKKAVDEGVRGAEQWYQRRLRTVVRCEELIKWLKREDVKDGDRIKLADLDDISHLDRALEANGKKRIPKIENYKRKKLAHRGEVAVELISVKQLLANNNLLDPQGDDDDSIFNGFILDDF